MIEEIKKILGNPFAKIGHLYSIKFTTKELDWLQNALTELKNRRDWMKPWDELYNDEKETTEESWGQIIDRHIKRLNNEMDELREKFNRHIVETYKPSEPTCEHAWILSNSSTSGNTYRCVKCGNYKHETWSAGTGGYYVV